VRRTWISVVPALLALVILAGAPLAEGATREFTGPASDAGTVTFDAVLDGKKAKKVVDFDAKSIAFACTGPGPTLIGGIFEGKIKVKDNRRFSATQVEGEGSSATTMDVAGRFAKNGKSATGTVRIAFANPEFGQCDSLDQEWEATR
jgi:hypothetical protein